MNARLLHLNHPSQKVLIFSAPNPIACLVVYPGFDGNLDLDGTEPKKLTHNFLVRNCDQFLQRGLSVALVDSPARLKGADLKRASEYRRTSEMLKDYGALLAELKPLGLPIWLSGTSRSVETVLTLLNSTQHYTLGGILLSCLTENNEGSRSILEIPVDQIDSPLLVIHHEKDPCPLSKPELITGLMSRLGPIKKELFFVKGGFNPKGAQLCKGNSLHGFWGADQAVVAKIDNFVRENSLAK